MPLQQVESDMDGPIPSSWSPNMGAQNPLILSLQMLALQLLSFEGVQRHLFRMPRSNLRRSGELGYCCTEVFHDLSLRMPPHLLIDGSSEHLILDGAQEDFASTRSTSSSR